MNSALSSLEERQDKHFTGQKEVFSTPLRKLDTEKKKCLEQSTKGNESVKVQDYHRKDEHVKDEKIGYIVSGITEKTSFCNCFTHL